MKIGLLLPHFGRHCDATQLPHHVVNLERLGYDSVWVRDHVVYRPHAFEDSDTRWVDPFVVLSVAATHSERVTLGTAALIPHRHPIQTAILLSNLASIAGSDRLIVGWGRGNDPNEFDVLGLDPSKRGEALEEQVEIIRRLWVEGPTSFEGRHHSFSNVRISAAPGLGKVPFLYGGSSALGIRRAARRFDGLLASRIPRFVLGEQISALRHLAAELGRPAPIIGLVLLVSPARTTAVGLKHLNMDGIYVDTQRRFRGHDFRTLDDLDGVVVAGTAERIADELRSFADIGVTHIVIDLRARFAEWDDCVVEISESVLPLLRRQT